MSTNRDELVSVLSHWLARHVDDDGLRRALENVEKLSGEQAEAVEDLRGELANGRDRGELERAVREALEALALG